MPIVVVDVGYMIQASESLEDPLRSQIAGEKGLNNSQVKRSYLPTVMKELTHQRTAIRFHENTSVPSEGTM